MHLVQTNSNTNIDKIINFTYENNVKSDESQPIT